MNKHSIIRFLDSVIILIYYHSNINFRENEHGGLELWRNTELWRNMELGKEDM